MTTLKITSRIDLAASFIKTGGLVAVPTETVYGLAGNGLDEEAVRKIYEAKGRPAIKPLSLMVCGKEDFQKYCSSVPNAAYYLAERYWPGPLTIVLSAVSSIPEITLAGGTTVGLRCPDHPLTMELLNLVGVPLAAPSANISGQPSPKNASQVFEYFDGKIDAVIDGGECSVGTESTIVDLSDTPFRVLREGAIPTEEIENALCDSLKLIGITGGTGAGKTTALKVLENMGALILDCDEIYHHLTVSCADMRNEIIARFGNVYDNEVLNRKKLGQIVFNDANSLQDLNAITHKYVSLELNRRIKEFALSGGNVAAIDAIELLSIPLAEKTICNVAVTAPYEARVARLMRREGISEEYAKSRIAAQKSDAYFESHCDYVLRNDSDQNSFIEKCRDLFMEVLNYG